MTIEDYAPTGASPIEDSLPIEAYRPIGVSLIENYLPKGASQVNPFAYCCFYEFFFLFLPYLYLIPCVTHSITVTYSLIYLSSIALAANKNYYLR